MMQRQTRVMQQHSWTRIPHDLPHFLFHVWFVAMDEAFAAGALLFLKRALFEAHESVGFEFGAFGAEFSVGAVVGFAVDMDHGVDGFFLPCYPWMLHFGLLACHVVVISLCV